MNNSTWPTNPASADQFEAPAPPRWGSAASTKGGVANDYTIGTWQTETDSAAALDEALSRAGHWITYKEVPGTLVQPRAGQGDKGVRIDRVLIPTTGLIKRGWTHGAVGIEIKRSGMKIGRPIAQAMDYGRSAWVLPNGISVWLGWVFIWPLGDCSGAVESILCQNRLGSAYSTNWDLLHLRSGPRTIISVDHAGNIRGLGAVSHGTKVGSR